MTRDSEADDDAYSEEELREQLVEFDEAGDELAAAEVVVDLAGLHYSEGRLSRSIDLYRDALARVSGLSDDADDLAFWARYGLMFAFNDLERDIDAAQAAAELVRRHLDDAVGDQLSPIASALAIHARALCGVGEVDAALETLTQARARIAMHDGDEAVYALARVDMAIGIAFDRKGETEEALARLDAASDLLSPLDGDNVEFLAVDIVIERARVLGSAGSVADALKTLDALAERYAGHEHFSRLSEDARRRANYLRASEAHRLLSRVGRAREAERLARRAIADGDFSAWTELAYVLAVRPRQLAQEEHAWRQARAFDHDRATHAAVYLGILLAYGRGDLEGARAVFAEIADGDTEEAGFAASQLAQLDRPGWAFRRLRWRLARARDAITKSSPPARLVGKALRR